MAKQPREGGRFACVPSYPRKRWSPCGCGGGGNHPCPVVKLERELDNVQRERAAVQEHLGILTATMRTHGHSGNRGANVHLRRAERSGGKREGPAIEDETGALSVDAYRKLLEERRALAQRDKRLAHEARTLRSRITRVGGRSGHVRPSRAAAHHEELVRPAGVAPGEFFRLKGDDRAAARAARRAPRR